MSKPVFMLLAVIGSAAVATPAFGQRSPDLSRRPSFGTLNLPTGFTPDPREVAVTAGGRLSAERVSSECRGSIANAPDVRVNYSAGSLPLTFYATSNEDTTLVVNGPDGRWYCNDDSDGVNPRVTFRAPTSGQYDVYVGHFGGSRRVPARLFVSEIVEDDNGGGERPDLSAEPLVTTLNLRAGFRRGRDVNVTAGGPLSASTLGSSCGGAIGRVPDVRVNYTGGRVPLIFSATSRADTTLAINGPDGEWYCDDDTNGSDPEVRFDRPSSGQYDVFIGHYTQGQTAPARLSVSEGRR